MNKTIEIDKLNLFYQEFGSGDKYMILLHGWGQSHAFWGEFVKKFSDKYHIYVLDLPGFGMSQEPTTLWKIKDYSQFIYAFVSKLKINNPVFIGHSFGGRVAIMYASQFPVKKLILYSTGGGVPELSFVKILNKSILLGIGKYLLPNLLYKWQGMILRPKEYKNKALINTIRSRRMLDIYTQPPQYLHEALKKIDVKTLVLVGEKDYITKPAIGVKVHKLIKNSQLQKIPKATHFSHIESPENFYRIVEGFLEERQ